MSAAPSSPMNDLGGKAAQLLELQHAGFPVPAFVCSPPDLESAVADLGFPLAVRSSASAEDGGESSFAGQFQSFLDLKSLDEVRDAIRRCEESLHAESVAHYCKLSNIDPTDLRMSVIIQRMVDPELAGVAFTVNPTTGAEEVVIEACAGLADRLLSGEQEPLPDSHPLVHRHAPAIEEIARKIHRHYGAPQDIEFAIENECIQILQARPITRIQHGPETGEWTNADFRDGGVSSDVCTPLMWSLYEFAWDISLKDFLRDVKLFKTDFPAARLFFGRPYWNLGAVKQCLARLPGFIEREFDRDLSVEPGYPGDGIHTRVTVAGLLRALPTVLAVPAIWKRQQRVVRELLDGGFDTLLAHHPLDTGRPEDGFTELIHDAYRLTETCYFRTIFCASLAKMAFVDSFPDADYPALVAALPTMRHLDPTRAMREMAARGDVDIAGLQQQFAHRGRRELDIRAPRWDEDPEWVRDLLSQQSAAPARDPLPAYEEARNRALASLPARQRRKFIHKLDRLRHFLWLREEMRDLSSRLYHRIRRQVLAIAEHRGLGDDIFFMSFQDIIADDRSGIAANRERFDSFRNFAAPNEIGGRFTFTPEARAGAMTGIAASRGRVTAIARIARSIEETGRVEAGSILVCPFTDPGWTPVLDRVAGVITETGGLLSHAAVICRECGIPAILGVHAATRRITDGSTITLDADRGVIETHSSP